MSNISALNLPDLLANFPKRDNSAHKGTFGHVLIVGGDMGYPGAPVLAALGALRVGAGLVTLASHSVNLIGINACHPEIMCHSIDDPNELTHLLTKVTVVVLGPGLGRSTWSQKVFNMIIDTNLPLLLDADALFFLAQNPSKSTNRILTPHPGEAANLLQQWQAIPVAQREEAIAHLITKFESTIVLKGAGTLVGSKETAINICNAGNPGMASGGMGDLLSGVIGGLMAQGLSLDLAAKIGVCIHAMAGDVAAQNGQRGIIATDLLLPIKQLIG